MQMQRTRHVFPRLGLAAVVAAALLALAPGAAQAQKGRIIVSDVEFASYASEKEMAQAIKKHGGYDPEALRKAALETDIAEGGTIQGYGVKFFPPGTPMAA